jgi:peptidoglycan/LPS O-acetylase OafA/YrhL
MAISQGPVQNYRPDIDGLRAIAILSVVLYHAGLPLLSGGFTGVDIFFTISGYLIGGHIFSEANSGTFSFLRFYQRRAKRILPAFYLVLGFVFLTAIVLLSPFETYKLAIGATASILSVSNVYFLHSSNYFQTKSEFNPLLMTWSLGVEEQFYAVIPILMVLLARLRRRVLLPAIIVVCAMSFAFACREVKSHPDMVFYLLPARAWELGVGVALAVAELSWKRRLFSGHWAQAISLIGFTLMLAPMYLLSYTTPFPGAAALPSILGTALMIATPVSAINRRFLSLTPLTFIGRISYSWYLWHWPMLAFLRIASGGMLQPSVAAIAIALSFAAAVLSYYFVEQPFRKSSLAAGPLLFRYAAVSIGFAFVGAVLWLGHGFPKRYPELIQVTEPGSDPCLVDYGTERPNLSSRCYPASDPRFSVVLWGDSHSAALGPALRQSANTQGYNFIQLGKSSCLPLNGVAKIVPQHPLVVGECIHFNQQVLNLIAADSRIRIVIMAGVWSEPFRDGDHQRPLVSDLDDASKLPSSELIKEEFVQSLYASVRSLRSAGKCVVVVDDVPNFEFDPMRRFLTARIAPRRAIAVWLGADTGIRGFSPSAFASAANISTALLHETLAGIPGVELVDLQSALCNGQGLCAYQNGDQLLYSDGQHLTADGARFALRNFRLPSI